MVGAVCLLGVVCIMIIMNSIIKKGCVNLDNVSVKARRRANRQKLLQQLAVVHIIEEERRTQHCRQETGN